MHDSPVSVSRDSNSPPATSARKNFFGSIAIVTPLLLAMTLFLLLPISFAKAAEFDFISAEATKSDKIRDLIKISGMETMISQMIPTAVTQQFALVGSLRKDIPRSLLRNLANQTTLEMMASKRNFLEALVPVYDRHMTMSEISALLEIYKNPVLVSILKKIPALTHDSREVAKYWGKAVSNKVFRHLSEKLMHKGYRI